MNDLILLGGGSHCKSVLDTLSRLPEWDIVGILDVEMNVGNTVKGVQIIGEDHELMKYYKKGIKNVFVTIGGTGDNTLRKKLFNTAKAIGFNLPNIIDPTATISKFSKITAGCFVGKGAIINTDVRIGENSIINTGVIIDHDGTVGSHCHIAPGSTLSGGVTIGNETHIGTNSTIIQNIKIGSNTLIGAGSVVVHDIESNKKAFGNPCKVVET